MYKPSMPMKSLLKLETSLGDQGAFSANCRVGATERSCVLFNAAKRHRDGNLLGQELSGVATMTKPTAKKPMKTKTIPYDVAEQLRTPQEMACLLYTSDAADDLTRVDLGG